MQSPLFRKQALERLSSPEQLDQLLQITRPRAWLALIGLSAIVVAALFWSFGGSIPLEASGKGILVRPPGNAILQATSVGTITALAVQSGERVKAGQLVARLKPSQGPEVDMSSPIDGEILSLDVRQGGFVSAGAPIATIEPLTEDLEAILFVPAEQGKNVRPGMATRILPSTVQAEEYGIMLGKVVSVSQFPATRERINLIVQNDALADALTGGGPVYEVRLAVTRDDNTQSGYKWSSPKGPPIDISSGTLCSADIVLREQRPINLAFPASNK